MSEPTPRPIPESVERLHTAIALGQVEADPTKPVKAIVAAALSAVGTFVACWVADADPFTAKEAGQAFLLALAASGVTGVPTFAVHNPLRRRPPGKHRKG
jgi:hypothetical protein